jgi:hypothetical protein
LIRLQWKKKKDDSCVTRVGWLQQCQPP